MTLELLSVIAQLCLTTVATGRSAYNPADSRDVSLRCQKELLACYDVNNKGTNGNFNVLLSPRALSDCVKGQTK